jgi:hypothetical protein
MKTKRIPVPENWKDLKTHPLSQLVPYGQGIETVKLANQMRRYGYDDTEPIVLFDGMILDGRHRLVGAQEADVTPNFAELVDGDLVGFVSKKLHRQHLNESQRAMFVAALIKAESQNKRVTLRTSQDQADAADVSLKTMTDAKKVEEEASDEVKEEISKGNATVSQSATALRSVFCRNCRLNGPKKKCKDCAEKRKEMGVAALNKPKGKGSKPKKPGSEKFDWKTFDTHYGFVARGPHDLQRAYGKCDEFIECDALLRKFREEWAKWRKRVLKSKE